MKAPEPENSGAYTPRGENIPLSVLKTISCLAVLCVFLLPGCVPGSGFKIQDLAKTNIDTISEIHMNQAVKLLKSLTCKLYKKNPSQLKKGQSISSRLDQIFRCPSEKYAELDFQDSTKAILMGLDPKYTGDRVFAVMYGLYTMIRRTYNNKCELFLLDYLDSQKLYNSARNIEILVWRLKTRLSAKGRPLLLTNSLDGNIQNLSFERIFGKLISIQDTMALIVSNRTGRAIKEAVQIAGMAFLPIGI